MNLDFKSGEELLALCKEKGCPISAVMRSREVTLSGRSVEEIDREMTKNLDTMKESVRKGLYEPKESVSGLSGGDAERLMHRAEKALMGEDMAMLIASSMAVVEVNAAMGRIVAAPTAGASGILPGVLLSCAKKHGWTDEMLLDALYTAGAVGMLIARNASISGAEGGCQAETGTGAAMTAAALAELSGGSPEVALTAAAIALKNVMGLICDPVAGLVECPCIKRNAIGAANGILSADLALAGIKSLIPFDEVVTSMKNVGRLMSADLKETARGGIATSPTGKAIRKQLGLNEE